ncbi:hypothetical protein V6N12_000855 [Hibiscus sabdariffa]|uniref:Uncharacterized protein n=1 Tax=Hibiscus sabdariffa TaxID=183260 RepID=A0ABR2BY12_9ROSI
MADLKSSLMSSPDNVTNSGTFPLVIVNGDMQQMEKSDNGRGSTQDPLTFRGLNVTSGSGPAHASGSGPAHGCPSSPTLTPDQFSVKSGSSGLGPALQIWNVVVTVALETEERGLILMNVLREGFLLKNHNLIWEFLLLLFV